MIALLLSLALAQAQPELTVRRFALVAGANDGGATRVTLRYANTDAQAIAKVMTQLGGVDPRDVLRLEDPSVDQLNVALDQLAVRLREAGQQHARVEVFFYYSGHSDDAGLLLKGDRLTYAALRKRLDSLPAEVRIAVLDSCASGALTLLKGGTPRPSFLVDSQSSLTGHAFLTSSSADESAQESERLKASIFTHYFLSGLRGAADVSHDGRVTLTEAYQYAFAQTLARTTSTLAGPQRPGYDIQLVGSGDLVLTDLRASSSRVVLDSELGGRVYILGPGGNLVVEVAKVQGKPVELGLEPGEYRLVLDQGGANVSETKLTLAAQESKTLDAHSLTASALEPTVLRGDAPMPHLFADISVLPSLSFGSIFERRPRVNLELGLAISRIGALKGVDVSSFAAWVDEDLKGFAVAGGVVRGGSIEGFAVSGGLLASTGETSGFTVASVAVSGGDLSGFHVAPVSLALANVSGVQAGMIDFAAGDVTGAQLGMIEVAGGNLRGLQAGLINIGGDVTGAQLGLVNIAHAVHGTQIGLVNIAETSDVPIGLVSIITKGHVHLAAWGSETSVANVALKLGGEGVYTLLTGGFNPHGGGQPFLSYGAGIGLRKRSASGKWYGELEASVEDLHQLNTSWDTSALSTGLRLNIGYQLFDGLAIFAGPQFNVLVNFNTSHAARQLAPWGFAPSDKVALVPGVVLGLQFL